MNVKAPVHPQCCKFLTSQQKSKSKFPLHHPERNQEFYGAFYHIIFQVSSYAREHYLYINIYCSTVTDIISCY